MKRLNVIVKMARAILGACALGLFSMAALSLLLRGPAGFVLCALFAAPAILFTVYHIS